MVFFALRVAHRRMVATSSNPVARRAVEAGPAKTSLPATFNACAGLLPAGL